MAIIASMTAVSPVLNLVTHLASAAKSLVKNANGISQTNARLHDAIPADTLRKISASVKHLNEAGQNVQIKDINGANVKFVSFKTQGEWDNVMAVVPGVGMVGCTYYDVPATERDGEALVQVTGVSDFDSLENAKITGLTQQAKDLGIKKEMTGGEALLKMVDHKQSGAGSVRL